MEQNIPVATNKLWSFVRLTLFIIRKNISKTKLLLDLNMMVKRGKIAGKSLHNLMLHHHRSASAFNRRSPNFTFPSPLNEDYEFSCTTSPVYKNISQKKSTVNEDHDEIFVDPAVIKAMEMLTSAAASPSVPGFPGFGKSPMVRQLRVTDSPFPLSNEEEDSYVDEAAEKFIMKFYNDLRRQN